LALPPPSIVVQKEIWYSPVDTAPFNGNSKYVNCNSPMNIRQTMKGNVKRRLDRFDGQ